MAARCADVDAALEAPCLERRLGFSRAVGAIGEHVSLLKTLSVGSPPATNQNMIAE
jgi:hypothetical protein